MCRGRRLHNELTEARLVARRAAAAAAAAAGELAVARRGAAAARVYSTGEFLFFRLPSRAFGGLVMDYLGVRGARASISVPR